MSGLIQVMRVCGAGTHLIALAQTSIDGGAPDAADALYEGAAWRWFGEAIRLDGPGAALLLANRLGGSEQQAGAARVVRKFFRTHGAEIGAPVDLDDAVADGGFIVSDGRSFFPVVPITCAREPLLVFAGAIPPVNRTLTVVKVGAPRRARTEPARGMLCFTPGTRIRTPHGEVPVESLMPGDWVQTKDDGRQDVLWLGKREISGARMRAEPGLRPIRIRAGALGGDQPQPDLVVSPDHRVLLSGRKADLLFNTPEVLVRARDLLDDRGVRVDAQATEVVYIHLLLARHQIIWANGVETESFHPASAHLPEAQSEIETETGAWSLDALHPGLAQDPELYGPHARRCLSTAELAVLRYQAPPHYLT